MGLLLALFSAPAAAQTLATAAAPDVEPTLLQEANEWRAFAAGPAEERVCYMTNIAAAASAATKGDHRPAVFVSHRPHRNAFSVVTFVSAQKFKEATVAFVRIANEEFRLFTVGDLAWAPDAERDQRLVKAMRDAATVTLRGLNEQGKLFDETVSLMGFTAAHNRISAECKPR